MSVVPNDWAYVTRWNDKTVESWRTELESLTVTPDRANVLRGMIDAIRQQRAHFEPKPLDPEPEEPGYGY